MSYTTADPLFKPDHWLPSEWLRLTAHLNQNVPRKYAGAEMNRVSF